MIPPQFASSTPSLASGVQPRGSDAVRSDRNDAKNSPSSGASFSQVLATYSKGDDNNSNRTPADASKDPSGSDSKAAADPAAVAPVIQPQPPLTITGLLGLLQQQPQKDAQDTNIPGDSAAADAAPAEPSQQNQQPDVSVLKASVLPLTAPLVLPVGTSKAGPKAADSKTLPGTRPAEAPLAFAPPVEFVRAPGETDNAPNAVAVDAAAGAANGAPAQPSGNTTAAAGAAALTPQAPLAFSMLVSPNSQNAAPATPQTTAAFPDAPARAPDVPHFSSGIAAAATVEAAPGVATEHSSDGQANTMAAPLAQAERTRGSDDRVPTVEPSSAGSRADVDPGAAADRSESVRNVRLQVEGENNQRVDVRMTEQGGELRVNVRSADANLTQAMQDHMPDLTNRLQQQHFRTEVWVPRSSQTSDSNASNTRGSHSQAGDASGQQNSGRRQNGRQNNQRDWQDEETPGQTATQETNYIWQA